MHGLHYTLRPMEHGDVSQVGEIDREAFPGEWALRSQSSYKQDLHNSSIHYVVACVKSDARQPAGESTPRLPWFRRLFRHERGLNTPEHIIGFTGFWMMLREAHIIAVGVREGYRRVGVGEALLIATIDLSATLNANVVTLEVRASNAAAQALYSKYGFKVMGRRVKYYSSNGEDAIIMSTDDITSTPFQASFERLKVAHAGRHGGVIERVG
jgi:[ribosomal protein S18]-alanine N-acetyltransferase